MKMCNDDGFLWGADIKKSNRSNELMDVFNFFESQNKKNMAYLKSVIEGFNH